MEKFWGFCFVCFGWLVLCLLWFFLNGFLLVLVVFFFFWFGAFWVFWGGLGCFVCLFLLWYLLALNVPCYFSLFGVCLFTHLKTDHQSSSILGRVCATESMWFSRGIFPCHNDYDVTQWDDRGVTVGLFSYMKTALGDFIYFRHGYISCETSRTAFDDFSVLIKDCFFKCFYFLQPLIRSWCASWPEQVF